MSESSVETKPNNPRPNVGLAGIIMMLSLFLSRVLGLIRESIISGTFGLSKELDAYTLSFQIPDLLFFLIAGGALSSAFIPVFSEYWNTDRRKEAWHIFSSVTTIMATALVILVGICWIFAEPLTYLVAAKAPDDLRPLITQLSRIVLPAQIAFFVGGIMFGTLYVRQVFSVPGLGPNVYNLGIIFGGLVLIHFTTPRVLGLSYGVLIGAVLGFIVIPGIVMARMGAEYKPTFDTKHPGVRKVFKLMLPVVLGLSLPGVFGLIMQNLGTLYQSTGVNGALKMGNILMQVPLALFGQSFALAIFPALSQFRAENRPDLFDKQLQTSLRITLYLSIPATALFIAIPEAPIRVLFEHGNWTAANTEFTAHGLRMFAIGIVGWCLQPLIMRAYFASSKPVPPIVLGTVATAIFLAIGWPIAASRGDYALLPLAGSIAALVLAVMMVIGVKKLAPTLSIPSLLDATWRMGWAAALPAAALYGLHLAFPELLRLGGKIGSIAIYTLVFLLYAWAYYFLTKAQNIPETSVIARAMNRLNRKKGDSQNPDPN